MPPRRTTPNTFPTIQRTVHFFRLKLLDEKAAAPFDPKTAADAIDTLAFVASGPRYLEMGDGIYLVAIPEQRVGDTVRFTLGTSRHKDIPMIETGGVIGPMALAAGSGVFDRTHLVFFPDGIVGSEFNFWGPRATRMAYYLSERCPSVPKVALGPLLSMEAQKQLENLEEISLLEFAINVPRAALVDDLDRQLMATLNTLSTGTESQVVEIKVKPKGLARSEWRENTGMIARILRYPFSKDHKEKLKVHGPTITTGAVEIIDMLSDKLLTHVNAVSLGSHRGVDSASMFIEIEGAYSKGHDDIQRASAVIT